MIVQGVSDEDAMQYPLVENTEENLVELGVDPITAHTMMRISRGEIPGDEIVLEPRKK